MADHRMGGASQGGQRPENNILQQILDKIQEKSMKIAALEHFQPAQQLLDKIQEQSLKIEALEHAQRTPANKLASPGVQLCISWRKSS